MLMPKSFDPKSIRKPHLVTIPYSHYCELSRWALEHAGIAFEEVKYSPGYHAKMVGQLRRDKADRSETSYVGQESGVHGGRRKYAVPLLCLPGGQILRDSWEISEHALGPMNASWLSTFDQVLGIAVRQLGYHYLLSPDSKHLIKNMIASSSIYERILWRFIGGKVTDGMRQLLAITQDNAEKAKETIGRVFASVGDALTEGEGRLDPENDFGPTDIAFCSLGAYCVMPENFGNGAVDMPTVKDFPAEFQDFIYQCRDTDAGQYILKCYAHKRTSTTEA